MTIEQRLDQLEKRNKRLTVGLTMTVVAMCAVVTMAATGEQIELNTFHGEFDMVTARSIHVENGRGDMVVALSADTGGNGLVTTLGPHGKALAAVGANDKG